MSSLACRANSNSAIAGPGMMASSRPRSFHCWRSRVPPAGPLATSCPCIRLVATIAPRTAMENPMAHPQSGPSGLTNVRRRTRAVASDPPEPSPSMERDTTRNAASGKSCSDRTTTCRTWKPSVAHASRESAPIRSALCLPVSRGDAVCIPGPWDARPGSVQIRRQAPADAIQVVPIGRVAHEKTLLDDRADVHCDQRDRSDEAVAEARIGRNVTYVADGVGRIHGMANEPVDTRGLDPAYAGHHPDAPADEACRAH